jgi:hypothetical protein
MRDSDESPANVWTFPDPLASTGTDGDVREY